ncbi:hypothetical protein BDV96DRAFT_498594 [Lophiotrema nucula]|uniref:Geranylgeranyl pyrophosphate synthetase n=1 Tax=Lophiotrema nucula TaxID=690887 RepID=A0A6A5YYW3_9PLEO|nr:hypothetical protein BDV96DRAFT_498594 [Lophiotrema nucula]
MSFYGSRGRGSWRGSSTGSSVASTTSSYSSRGGGFSSRGKSSNWGSHRKRNDQEGPDISKHPLGQLLRTISPSDLNLDADQEHSISISNSEYVASYNWVNEESSTITIPGRPPRWTPLQKSQRLAEDKGDFFRDPNGARYPTHPAEPAVKAILELNPNYDTSMIDIVACGSTLGHILRFARGVDRPFRLTLDVIGNTVFFVRKENNPKELLKNVHGYGHTFLDEYTTWDQDVKGSESHQRLIQYELGGLRCVVRFEVDGYLGEKADVAAREAKSSSSDADSLTGLDDLISAMGATSVCTGPLSSNDTLTTRVAGSSVPQASIFDIKTRSGKYQKNIDMSDILPVLWLKQFPNFIIAYHDGYGLFKDIREQDVRADIQAWEDENREGLHKFVALLRKIVQIAKDNEGGRLDLYSPSAERLEIRKQHVDDNSSTLPPDLRAVWEGNTSEDGAEEEVENDSEQGNTGHHNFPIDSDSDDASPDYTACSPDSCGYCGRCSY